MGWGWSIDTESLPPVVTNSIGATHLVPNSCQEWVDIFNDASGPPELLWIVSLNYLVPLAKSDSVYAIETLRSFYDAFWEERDTIKQRLGSSWDHCSSLRLKTLCALNGSGNQLLKNEAMAYLRKEIDRENYWQQVALNNHGLMLIDALTGVALTFSESTATFGRCAEEFRRILRFVFGEDGFCNENSPAYHYLYIRLLRDICSKYSQWPQCAELVSVARDYLKLIEGTMSQQVTQDGMIPPLGDSNPAASDFESVDGTYFSERVGLWIYKRDDIFLSFKCGFESLTHKHADDTSIILRYRDEDLITDAGTANFNYRDPKILGLRTQKGHSGVYFPRFDGVHPAKLYSSGYGAKSVLVTATEKSVRGGYLISGNFLAHRHLAVLTPTRIRVEDHVSAIRPARSVVRFIVPPAVEVLSDKDGFWLFARKSQVRVRFNQRVKVSITCGQEEDPYKGWISVRPNETTSAKCVEVSRPIWRRGILVHTIDLMPPSGNQ